RAALSCARVLGPVVVRMPRWATAVARTSLRIAVRAALFLGTVLARLARGATIRLRLLLSPVLAAARRRSALLQARPAPAISATTPAAEALATQALAAEALPANLPPAAFVQPAVPASEQTDAAGVDAAGMANAGPGTALAADALVAEGLVELDRGEEALAYHLFVKATECPNAGQQAWFWRAKTAETLDDLVTSLERGLSLDPGNVQMQAHLAWASQRLDRQRRTLSVQAPAANPGAEVVGQGRLPGQWLRPTRDVLRLGGGLAGLALATLWMTSGLLPVLTGPGSLLHPADRAWLVRLALSLQVPRVPTAGQLPHLLAGYNLSLSLPFVLAFLCLFTGRGLLRGEPWTRGAAVGIAAAGSLLCLLAVPNPTAAHLGVALNLAMLLGAMAGRSPAPLEVSPTSAWSAGPYDRAA
ncbi:MAG: hypothetical protein ACYDAG_09045, partial [Chloroflexota bacterium]